MEVRFLPPFSYLSPACLSVTWWSLCQPPPLTPLLAVHPLSRQCPLAQQQKQQSFIVGGIWLKGLKTTSVSILQNSQKGEFRQLISFCPPQPSVIVKQRRQVLSARYQDFQIYFLWTLLLKHGVLCQSLVLLSVKCCFDFNVASSVHRS